MVNLIEHIEHLIREHDCVIVPGLGAFLATRESAYLTEDGSRFNPPCREVTFNADISHDDGLLLTSIMRRHKLSKTSASALIDEDVYALRRQMEATGEATLGRIGRLVKQEDATPVFEANKQHNPANIFSMLPTLSLTPIKQMLQTDEEECADSLRAGRIIGENLRRWAGVAAVVAVVALSAVAWMVKERNAATKGVESLSVAMAAPAINIMPERSEATGSLYIAYPDVAEATAVVKASVPAKRTEKATSDYIPAQTTSTKKAEQVSDKTTLQPTQQVAEQATSARSGATYHLIIASLPNRAAAEQFVAQNGNPSLHIVAMDGRYRVAISSSDNREELAARQSSVAAKYPGAWICGGK